MNQAFAVVVDGKMVANEIVLRHAVRNGDQPQLLALMQVRIHSHR